jgi:prepilin-type N-terminal cleavage/methylation domain-containing protein
MRIVTGARMEQQKKAFTLIELLVVISILSLLMAILVPTLTRVRKLAKRTVCASNLHQVGVALTTYASDDRLGRLPESNGYTCKYIPKDAYKSLSSIAATPKIMVCPEYTLFKEMVVTGLSDPELNRVYKWEPFPSQFDDGKGMWLGYYYLGGRDMRNWNWGFMPPDANKWISPRRLTDSGKLPVMVDVVEQASGKWFWVEAVHRRGGYAQVYYSGSPPEPEEIDAEGGNSIHLDGSVVWTKMQDLKKYPRSQPGPYRSFGYWHWEH